MEFAKYQHLERFGTPEVEGIQFGTCYVFPKIDGSNASIWSKDGELQFGSRRRHLSLDDDNQGFMAWASEQQCFKDYFEENPNHRLFGEWLIPHSLKTYREDAWRDFYVFDVSVDKSGEEILHEGDSKIKYLHYEDYKPILEKHGINFIPPLCTTKNATYEQFVSQLEKNVYLMQDGKGAGEGVVIKNYGWRNKYGRQTWAKIVTSEFKEKHAKAMGGYEVKGKRMVEEEIAEQFVTTALCEKVLAKIQNEVEWNKKLIPRLLNTVYYEVVREDSWQFVKKFKNPTINFTTLKHFVFTIAKDRLPSVFGESGARI